MKPNTDLISANSSHLVEVKSQMLHRLTSQTSETVNKLKPSLDGAKALLAKMQKHPKNQLQIED